MWKGIWSVQAYFAVVCGLAKQQDPKTLWEVTTCCVISHNMIVKDESEDVVGGMECKSMDDATQLRNQNLATFNEFIQMHKFGID